MKPTRFLGYGRQLIDDADKAAVMAVLDSDFLTQGPAIDRFEDAFAERVGAAYAVAVANGTAALHLACLAAEIGPGDTVVTSDLTFLASANAPLYCGADARLADIEADDLSISTRTVDAALGDARAKAVIPVHFAGCPAPLPTNGDGGKRVIIEDAAHALGASHAENGAPVGSCAFSDMACFSFHAVKTITTGEGGMVTTNNKDLAARLRNLRSHGIERDAENFSATQPGDAGPWSYEQQGLGFNYRITDLQAALGHSQLAKLDAFVRRRREIALRYDAVFARVEAIVPMQADSARRDRSGHHLYATLIDFAALGTTRADFMNALRERGIGTQVHYIPLHRQPYHAARDVGGHDQFVNTEAYYQKCLSLPLFPGMTDEEVEYVATQVMELVQQ